MWDPGPVTSPLYTSISVKCPSKLKFSPCRVLSGFEIICMQHRIICSAQSSFSINCHCLSLRFKAHCCNDGSIAENGFWSFCISFPSGGDRVFVAKKNIFFLNKNLFFSTVNVRKHCLESKSSNINILVCFLSFGLPQGWYSFIHHDHRMYITLDLNFLMYVLLLLNHITRIGDLFTGFCSNYLQLFSKIKFHSKARDFSILMGKTPLKKIPTEYKWIVLFLEGSF